MPILARPFPARRGLATPGFMRQSGPCRSTPDLAAGVLSAARFKHYITQDAHYLIGFGRALALAAAKAPKPDRIVLAIVVERALHGSFFAHFGITPQLFAETPLSPACHHYVSYLLATAYAESYEVVLGALLPCFWIYAGARYPWPGRAVEPLPSLDRYLCRGGIPHCRARHNRGYRRSCRY